MSPKEKIKNDMIQSFGHAYQAFGLNKLMGFVVALLIFSPEPMSLDEITEQLGMSKGPISQITRRLLDHKLIRRVWKPGERKHYYEIVPDIFGQAFMNNFELIKGNTRLAKELKASVEAADDPSLEVLHHRLKEMEQFYTLMEKHFQQFLDEWRKLKASDSNS
ncbi:MAG: MarR family transcriptional regulator [Calditrichaeota bacterium]|nr:MAG: MarR family transcriptional regulator [Calditrichota bacterium]